ncbi:hypothetical protein HDV00_010137 [Rhizophlyctis rosea]|nr:hypothetical protein HDV00_010137 [Rhizophlyctis rosea]
MCNLKTKKDMTFAQFKDMVGEEVGIPPARFRLWTMGGRRNKTIRPDTPIPDAALDTPMHVLAQKHTKIGVEGLRLYLEEAETEQPIATNPATGEPIWFLPVNEQGASPQFILFLKHYDPLKQKMRYAGKITMKSRSSRIGDLPALICARMQWPPNTEIRTYEEVKPAMIDKLDKLGITFQQAGLGDGDIICFQRIHDHDDEGHNEEAETEHLILRQQMMARQRCVAEEAAQLAAIRMEKQRLLELQQAKAQQEEVMLAGKNANGIPDALPLNGERTTGVLRLRGGAPVDSLYDDEWKSQQECHVIAYSEDANPFPIRRFFESQPFEAKILPRYNVMHYRLWSLTGPISQGLDLMKEENWTVIRLDQNVNGVANFVQLRKDMLNAIAKAEPIMKEPYEERLRNEAQAREDERRASVRKSFGSHESASASGSMVRRTSMLQPIPGMLK